MCYGSKEVFFPPQVHMFEQCPQLVVTLFWTVMEPLRGRAWLEEISHWTQSCQYLAHHDGLHFLKQRAQTNHSCFDLLVSGDWSQM